MQVIRGTYSGRETAIGYVRLCRVKRKRERAARISEQRERLLSALEAARSEIGIMQRRAEASVGEEHGEIFGLYIKILSSESLFSELSAGLETGITAEESVKAMLDGSGVPAEGEFDLGHVRESLYMLLGAFDGLQAPPTSSDATYESGEGYVYVSDGGEGGLRDLLEAAGSGGGKCPAAGTVCVSAEELAASVAIGLPSILIDPEDLPDESAEGMTAIIDCPRKRLILDPDLAELERYSECGRTRDEKERRLAELSELPSVTADGRKIMLCPEALLLPDGSCEGLASFGSDGSCLVLTDRLGKDKDCEDRAPLYKRLTARGRRIIVRLFKRPPSPFYTLRADGVIGLSGLGLLPLLRPIYRKQLSEILRGFGDGRPSILLPNVNSPMELTAFRSLCNDVRGELSTTFGGSFQRPRVGVELSTPSSLMSFRELIRGADFAVIDLDTLTSLMTATKTEDPISEELLMLGLPRALELCRPLCRMSAEEGTELWLRGRLAADPTLTEELIEEGYTGFFIPPGSILEVKERVIYCGEGQKLV